MGDRGTVVFTDDGGKTFSPGVYLHWAGAPESVIELIKKAVPVLRKNDAGYSAARFCGVCHADDPEGNTSLGLVDAPEDGKSYDDFKYWGFDGYGPGDNGVYIVDVRSCEVRRIDGYDQVNELLDVDISAIRG